MLKTSKSKKWKKWKTYEKEKGIAAHAILLSIESIAWDLNPQMSSYKLIAARKDPDWQRAASKLHQRDCGGVWN